MKPRNSNGKLFLNILETKKATLEAQGHELTLPATQQPIPKYPYAIEREYAREIKKTLRRFTLPVYQTLSESLYRWLQEQKRAHLDRQDSMVDEMQGLNNELENTQEELFGNGGIDYKVFLLGFGIQLDDFNKTEWIKQLKWVAGKDSYDSNFFQKEKYLDDTLRLWADQNYILVKSLSDEYIKKMNNIVSTGVLNNESYTEIMGKVRALNTNMTEARSKLIAVDQMGKLNGYLTEARQKDVGVEWYKWLTAQDERVVGNPAGLYPRPTSAHGDHYEMNGSINKWGDRLVYSKNNGVTFINRPSSTQGEIPGSAIRCRCIAIAVFDKVIAELE